MSIDGEGNLLERPRSRRKAQVRARVLITNAEERAMLAVCRTLAEGGYEVTASSSTRIAAAAWSRSSARRVRVSAAYEDAGALVEHLRAELGRRSYATLIAGTDSTLLAVSRGRERLGSLTELGLPDPLTVESALSRETLVRAAAQEGFTVATSIPCASLAQALSAARELGFPVMLKAADAARARGVAVRGAPKSTIVTSSEELVVCAPEFGEQVLVQRWIDGDLISVGGVVAGGKPLGLAMARYLRTWPPDSGSVCFGETLPLPGRLERLVGGLLRALGWQGIFELELIRTPTGEFVPIDFNPRPYGSMALAAAAGAPLARLWCDWLLGRDPQPARARAGVRYRWEDGDLRHLAWQLRRRRLRAAIAPLRPRRRVVHAHFKLTDPLPMLARTVRLAQIAPARRRARRKGAQAVVPPSDAAPGDPAPSAHSRDEATTQAN